MSENSSEITSKIRSAIKAKLMELGAYVDDELPDYIMVMIANKKTRQQMTEDLNLFLGKNSNVFCEWLHNVLERLQTIGRGAGAGSSGGAISNLAQNISTSTTIPKEKPKEKEKERKKKSHRHHKKSAKKRRESGDSRSSDTDDEKKERKLEKPGVEKEKIPTASTAPKNSTEWTKKQDRDMDEDILVVAAEIEEGDELADAFKKEEQGPLQSQATSNQINSGSSTVRKLIEAPSPDTSRYGNNRHVGTVKPMKRRTPSPAEAPARKRRSAVVQVVHRPDFSNTTSAGTRLDEEYDPTRPQIGSAAATSTGNASVASTIRVTERKYTVPREMQPKPSIFLRAISEANRSVKEDNGKKKEKPSKSTENQGVFERVVMNEPKMEVQQAQESKDMPKTGGRRVQLRRSTKPQGENQPIKPEPMEEMDQDAVVVDDAVQEKGKSSPRFVVTMSGLDRKFVERLVVKAEEEERQGESLAKEEDYYNDQDTLIVDMDEDELMEEAMFAYSGSKTPIQVLPGQQIVNPIKINLDDDDEEDEDMDQKQGDTIVVGTSDSGTNESAAPSPRVVDDSGVSVMERGVRVIGLVGLEQPEKIMERCRYWPNCKLGMQCQYQHPMINCKNFPQCRFGDKCLYIHPPCKFGPYCKNSRCPFAHNRVQQLSSPVSMPGPGYQPRFPTPLQHQGSNAFIPCKFGGRCTNPACTFRHPHAPCMYGAACTKPNCAYSHRMNVTVPMYPPAMQQQRPILIPQQRPISAISGKTDIAKFRWTAPQQTTSVNVNEASSESVKSEGATNPMVA